MCIDMLYVYVGKDRDNVLIGGVTNVSKKVDQYECVLWCNMVLRYDYLMCSGEQQVVINLVSQLLFQVGQRGLRAGELDGHSRVELHIIGANPNHPYH